MWFDHQSQCKNSGATTDTVVNIPREMGNLDDEQTRHSQNSVCFYLGHPDAPYPLGSTGIQKPIRNMRRPIQFPRGKYCHPYMPPSMQIQTHTFM